MKALGENSPLKMITGLVSEFFRTVPAIALPYLVRMNLDKPDSFRERLYMKMVVLALRLNKKL
jgi:hypothetical protein